MNAACRQQKGAHDKGVSAEGRYVTRVTCMYMIRLAVKKRSRTLLTSIEQLTATVDCIVDLLGRYECFADSVIQGKRHQYAEIAGVLSGSRQQTCGGTGRYWHDIMLVELSL